MVTATTTHGLTSEGGSGNNTHSGISSIVDSDRSIGMTAEFRLLGIAFSNSPGQTLAVIETTPGRHQRFIHEGDSIGEVKVKKILRDRVVFETDQGERIARLNSAFLDSARDDSTLLSEQAKTNPFPTVLRRNQTVEVDRKKLSSSLANIDKIARDVKISSVNVYGRPIGVRISPIEPGSVFDEIGLKNGDVIRAVNGKPVMRPEDAANLLEKMRAGGEFNIFVKGSRYSRTIQLVVN